MYYENCISQVKAGLNLKKRTKTGESFLGAINYDLTLLVLCVLYWLSSKWLQYKLKLCTGS